MGDTPNIVLHKLEFTAQLIDWPAQDAYNQSCNERGEE